MRLNHTVLICVSAVFGFLAWKSKSKSCWNQQKYGSHKPTTTVSFLFQQDAFSQFCLGRLNCLHSYICDVSYIIYLSIYLSVFPMTLTWQSGTMMTRLPRLPTLFGQEVWLTVVIAWRNVKRDLESIFCSKKARFLAGGGGWWDWANIWVLFFGNHAKKQRPRTGTGVWPCLKGKYECNSSTRETLSIFPAQWLQSLKAWKCSMNNIWLNFQERNLVDRVWISVL